MERATHLLLATTDDNLRAGGGRELLSRLLHAVLAELFDRVTIVRFTGRTTALNALQGRLNGIERHSAACAADPSITHALIDGSNLGALAWQIRRARPGLPVSCFFHNCETRFFQDAFAAAPGPRALAVLAGHWRAERRAVRGSQRLITLSERDSDELARRHGRGADAVVPLALDDRRDPAGGAVRRSEPYVLFVGGGFFGNVAGLQWYAREVAPRLRLPTLVVGRGLDALGGTLPANMELIGAVDALSPWYAGAAGVVAPILSGSGMKTKVAEALMHGKRVVGTTEAFSGYGAQVLAANLRADDAAGFANAVAHMAEGSAPGFDPALRDLYERYHSRAAFRQGLAAAIGI